MQRWPIPECFETEANADALAFLRRENPSAHSDVAEELTRAATSLPAQSFCPDLSAYAFIALHLEDFTIVGLAFGMSGLAFRLPEASLAEALRDGARPADEIGPCWIRLEPWRTDESTAESRERISRWCAVAVAAAAA